MKRFVCLVSLLLLVALPLVARADNQKKSPEKPTALREESKMWILRGLNAEAATVRKPLPHSNRGLVLHSDGKIEEKELEQDVRDHGPAARPGDVVKITGVSFEKDKIVFQINGGARGARHWLDHVQVGMGGSTHPVTDQSQPQPTGSSIALVFSGRVPDVTVDDVKQMLTPVLDFSRRSPAVVYTETLPKEVQEAIKSHKATVGMDQDMVLAALGRPGRKSRDPQKGTEDWIYGVLPARITIVTFQDDKVIDVKELTPGVPMTDVPRAEPEPKSPPVKKQ